MKGELVMTCRQLQSKAPLKSQSLRPNLQSLDVKQLSDIQQMYGKVPPQIHLEGTKGYCRPHWTKSFPSHKRKKRTSVHVASKLVTCLRQTSRNPTWWFSAFLKLCGIQSSNVSEADEPSTFNQISQKQESCKVRFRGKTPPAEIGRKWSGSLELPRNQQCDVGTLGCESHETNQRINVQTKCKANKRKARRRSSGRGMQSAMANGERWRVRFVEISWNMGLWYALMCFDPVDCVNQNRVDWINVANRPFRIIWHLQNAGWMPTMRHGPHMRRSFLGCVTVCHRAKCALWLQSCGGALVVCRHREINLK